MTVSRLWVNPKDYPSEGSEASLGNPLKNFWAVLQFRGVTDQRSHLEISIKLNRIKHMLTPHRYLTHLQVGSFHW